jgi:hypothetical protein
VISYFWSTSAGGAVGHHTVDLAMLTCIPESGGKSCKMPRHATGKRQQESVRSKPTTGTRNCPAGTGHQGGCRVAISVYLHGVVMVGYDAAVEDDIFVTPSSVRSGKSAPTRRLPRIEQVVFPGRGEMPEPVTLLDPTLTPPRSHPSRGQIFLRTCTRSLFLSASRPRAHTFHAHFSSKC